MLFYLIGVCLLLPCLFTDTSKKQLKKDAKDFKRLLGYDYIL